MSALPLVCTYAGLTLAVVLGERAPERAGAGVRAGWLAAVVTLAALAFGSAPPLDRALPWAVAPAGWAAAVALARRPGRMAGLGGIALGAGGLAHPTILDAARAAGLGLGLGAGLGWAIVHQRALGLRLLGSWAGFAVTLLWLLPAAASAIQPRIVLDAPWRGLGMGMGVLVAAPLCIAGTLGLARAGGTPDPLDPPPRLCTTGIYARIRHPLQIGEVLLAFAAAAGFGTEGALWYAVGFAVLLIGPIRWYEERILAERHGEAWGLYRGRVPAFVPRVLSRLDG